MAFAVIMSNYIKTNSRNLRKESDIFHADSTSFQNIFHGRYDLFETFLSDRLRSLAPLALGVYRGVHAHP